jgi:hypothetical protein
MTEPVFPEDSWVEIRYPVTREQEHADRAAWPWLPGWDSSEIRLLEAQADLEWPAGPELEAQ